MAEDGAGVRGQVLDELLARITADKYPSTTMLSMAEELLAPEDIPAYLEVLLAKTREDTYPSIPMLARIIRLASTAQSGG